MTIRVAATQYGTAQASVCLLSANDLMITVDQRSGEHYGKMKNGASQAHAAPWNPTQKVIVRYPS